MHPIIARILSRYYQFRLQLYLRNIPEKPNTLCWPRGYP